jgi:hypothetical protein
VAERTNPFHYGSPAEGDTFADREEELRSIVDRMLNGQNVILLSPRRYGKTSLLLEAIKRVRRRRGRSGYASLLLCTTSREIAETLLSAVLNGPLSWMAKQRHQLGELLGHLRLRPLLELDQLGNIGVSLSPGRAEEDWRQVIATVLGLLSEAEHGNHPVSLVLDEFQQVAEIDPSLAGIFKVMADQLRHVSLIFSGSRMHVMQQLAVGPAAPLMGMGERITLGLIPEEQMTGFLSKRARAGGKLLAAEDAHLIFELVDGIPNDVQLLSYDAFLGAADVVDRPTIETAMARIISHRAVDYAESYSRLAAVQQRVLKALAREPRAAVYTRSFVNEVDVANANSVRRALDALENVELVTRRGQDWTVADAFFRGWLRQAAS